MDRKAALLGALVLGSLFGWLLLSRKGQAVTEEVTQAAQTGAEVVTATLTGGRATGPRWERLLPAAQDKVRELVQLAQQNGLDVMFWEGWRDPSAEQSNIAKGTSHLKDPLNSLHVWGTAFDIVFRNAVGAPSWPDASDPRWLQLANLGESIGLRSGGKSWGWDWPHFELPGYTAASLRSQYGDNFLAFLSDNGAAVA